MSGESKYIPSGLEQVTYQEANWSHILTKNFELVDFYLSKISYLLDVDITGITNNSVLKWGSESKWVPEHFQTTSTTTTTTSTTTSSTQSTTSTTVP